MPKLPGTSKRIRARVLLTSMQLLRFILKQNLYFFRNGFKLDFGGIELFYCSKCILKTFALGDIVDPKSFYRQISQMPVLLVPADIWSEGGKTVVLRPFVTEDFMTGVPVKPGSDRLSLQVLDQICKRLLEIDGIGGVMYDVTPKPPGTTEWE
ncbi:hypothetical protein ACOME3_008088 [Neoechinorhynchus agilis]